MVKRIGNYQIPFDQNGNQLHYASSRYNNTEWKDNFKFWDTIQLSEMSRGQSAAYFHAVSVTTGKRYTVFMRDLLDMILYTSINRGIIEGTFTFRKRGQNYGLAILEEE